MWLVKKKSLYICVEVLEPIVMMLAEVEQIYPMSKLQGVFFSLGLPLNVRVSQLGLPKKVKVP